MNDDVTGNGGNYRTFWMNENQNVDSKTQEMWKKPHNGQLGGK